MGRFVGSCLIIVLIITAGERSALAQVMPGAPPTLNNPQLQDTSGRKTNTGDWKNEYPRIFMHQAGSQRIAYPDTSIHTFHRRPFIQPWYRDLGNLGSPARNLLFTPEGEIGLSLGYHVFDVYRYRTDSLYYYNTTRPYSMFTFNLGSRAEQVASLLHTQNIKPNWNIAAHYRKLTSPGFYKIQRNNDDNAALATNYQSMDQHYGLYAAVVYNKQQHDANGGIIADSLLADDRFRDRQTIAVGFENASYNAARSPVTNNYREFSALLQHHYTWGRTDTLYNEDSTQYRFKLEPRFSIGHRMEFSSEKYQYRDMRPDSLRYLSLFHADIRTGDSVQMEQKWRKLDNRFTLNGFFGPADRQLKFTAGIGNRLDAFSTYYITGENNTSAISNYLAGSISKEALEPGQWFYRGDAQLYMTGAAAGDFLLHGAFGKDLGKDRGELSAGIRQQLSSAPYSYTLYENRFTQIAADMGKQSVTLLYGGIRSARLKFSGGLRNYLVGNYIYLNQEQRPDQSAAAFNLTQVWLQKAFSFSVWVLDNELVFQQVTGNAPVHVPAFMGKHQLSIETGLFRRALKVATGVELRYHSAYYADGYSPFMGRFYYQDVYEVKNKPEASLFFNFKIKHFRAYIMGDQLQRFFYLNNIAAPGYPTQEAMLRFGFSWVMIN